MASVLVPLAQGCEELEAVTVIDLLRRAGIKVITASLDDQTIVASRGVRLLADCALDTVMDEAFDMLILPGGLPGSDHLDQDPRIHRLIQRLHQEGRYLAAICAAPKVLAHAGVLQDQRATGYPGVLDAAQTPGIQISTAAVEVSGRVITSRGPGTAIDFALQLIETLAGSEARAQVAASLVRS